MMMATPAAAPSPPAAIRNRLSTRASSSRPASRPTRSRRPPACGLRPSADLAGASVGLSPDVPAAFDTPLAAHHKLLGRWAAARETSAELYTRHEVRRRIETMFDEAVLDILRPFEIASLRVSVFTGNEMMPPAIAVICDSVGEIDLGWIAKDNVLANTTFFTVAPLGWRAAAYKELVGTWGSVLPVFGFDEMLEELSAYYWDSETSDEGARQAMIDWHGADPDDVDVGQLPSGVRARRPDWMLAENAAPLKDMPPELSAKIRRLRKAYQAVRALGPEGNAWFFDFNRNVEYMPNIEDCSHLPSLTLVPADHFAQELDDVGRHGMEYGFMDVAGLCELTDASKVDDWFASLKVGTEMLVAAQDLLNFDPGKR